MEFPNAKLSRHLVSLVSLASFGPPFYHSLRSESPLDGEDDEEGNKEEFANLDLGSGSRASLVRELEG